MGWVVMRPIWVRQAGHAPRREWEREPKLPIFETPAEARRAYMEGIDPNLVGKPDDMIKRHFQAWRSNVRGAKLQRV